MDDGAKRQTFLEKLQSITIYFPQIAISVVLTAAILGIGSLVFSGGTGGADHPNTNSNSSGRANRDSSSDRLADMGRNSSNTARGFITILFAIITVALALILILSVMFSTSPDYEKRFVMGKEVLTIFIGILGTIVGFYFGSAQTDNSKIPDAKDAIIEKVINQQQQQIAAENPKILPAMIYIQIYTETQMDDAKKLQSQLKEKNFIVPDIENVGDNVKNRANPISQNTIRYYNDIDKASAESVQSIAGSNFNLQKVSSKLNVKQGTIEVWFKTPDLGNKDVK